MEIEIIVPDDKDDTWDEWDHIFKDLPAAASKKKNKTEEENSVELKLNEKNQLIPFIPIIPEQNIAKPEEKEDKSDKMEVEID